jgi:ribose 5-phosphate isomerase RpiB
MERKCVAVIVSTRSASNARYHNNNNIYVFHKNELYKALFLFFILAQKQQKLVLVGVFNQPFQLAKRKTLRIVSI